VVDTSRQPELLGQTVVVIGGSSGMGLETGRRARAEGAEVILTGRNPQRLEQAGIDVGASKTAAFDATDPDQLRQFFDGLTEPIDHVMLTAGGSYYATVADMDFAQVRHAFEEHLVLPMQVARAAAGKMRPGGTLVFMTGTAARHPAVGSAIAGILAAAVPAFTANLALELAPVRVNLIAAGFVDTPLSASLMGGDLEKRREELRETLPVRRVVEPTDVARLAVSLMSNTAVTGATYDIDGGQQLLGTS
jgi:NAD(P)-dependent dehydrogenase (short-subunit alcohol dehydrogenase family)